MSDQNQPHELQEPTRYQCRHIFTGGRRCGSPALKGEQLCYHHHTIRLPIDPIALRTRRARTAVFELPPPEDHTSIQHSLGEILSRLASHDLDHRRAGVMLYSLHIATRNLKQNQPQAAPAEEEEIVEEITHDPILGPLAPIAEITRKKSFVAAFHERLILKSDLRLTREALEASKKELETTKQQLEAARGEAVADKEELEAEPTILPEIQAVAQPSGCPILRAPTGVPSERTCSLGWQPTAGEAQIFPSTFHPTAETSFRPKAAHLPPQRRTCPERSRMETASLPQSSISRQSQNSASLLLGIPRLQPWVSHLQPRFRFSSPAGALELKELPTSADRVMDSNPTGGKVRALIVDDSSVIRLVLGRILQEADLGLTDLLLASNGQQALEVLRQEAAASRHLDIILCDINMPVMNGIQFLEGRHAENLAGGVPVLVIATEACRPQVLNALAAGAKGYITKPFTVDQVKGQLAELLQAA